MAARLLDVGRLLCPPTRLFVPSNPQQLLDAFVKAVLNLFCVRLMA